MEWVAEHESLVQAGVGIVTALVWVVYLHILVLDLRRQRRTEILITLGGPRGLAGRILICNLGFEPIYVLDVLLRSRTDDDHALVSIADRDDDGGTQDPAMTMQTPLKTGEFVDIGCIGDLLDRAAARSRMVRDVSALTRVELTVAALTAATSSVVAAQRAFDISHDEEGGLYLHPISLYATQIRSRAGRRRIERQLQKML